MWPDVADCKDATIISEKLKRCARLVGNKVRGREEGAAREGEEKKGGNGQVTLVLYREIELGIM